ncbi:DNA topoisomerase IV subunit A [Neisseria sp. Ec49-e6-T10]|uniref:DNA topoisomerase IV subunit A n=1 Tax=Neisseria sp. Ec49-e6-T10 TaxID=3140744 RepID=UPI003EC01B86
MSLEQQTDQQKDFVGDDYLLLAQYAERAYLEYAMSVVKGRALPEVTDGQKPVQRRILFAMKDMGLVAGAKPVKSARVVGEILGKYHPHGDASAYDAMVRMAQDFTLRYPLIDGVGNFGSRDGDGAAAMRYTEARLSPLAELLLSEIDLGTVDFMPNYDGSFEEPKTLPARLPMVLLNGASGIAVGMATEIPSHNLKEVANAAIALLKKPDLDIAGLMNHISGPDFAGGGQIITPYEDLLNIYQTGKGSIRVRARYEIEKLSRGQWRMIVTQLPPAASAQKILAEIEELTNPKIKSGKKQLTQEQQNLKSLFLSLIDRVRDESDSESPVRLVFEPKSSRVDLDEFTNVLLAQTSLETNASVNLVMVGLDGRPVQKNLKSILGEWLEFRTTTVTRRLEHRLEQVLKRIHILDGRMIAFLHIDAIIKVIREADEPKQELMSVFHLTDIQAEDILEIRLRQLARLEGIKLEQELSKLQEEKEGLQYLLGNEDAKRSLIIDEIKADTKKFGDERRTLIETAQRAILTQATADEPITLILSKLGWLRSRVGHNVDLSQTTFKEGDDLAQVIETRTIYPVVVLDNKGRTYTVNAADIPNGRGDGVPVSSLIELQDNAQAACIMSSVPESLYLVTSSGGYGFIASLNDMTSRIKAGKAFFNLNDDEQMLLPIKLNEPLQNYNIILASSSNRILAFALSEIKKLGKGRGLQLINLNNQETLVAVNVSDQEKIGINIIGPRGKQIKENIRMIDVLNKRARRGKELPSLGKITSVGES